MASSAEIARMLRELKEEVAQLKQRRAPAGGGTDDTEPPVDPEAPPPHDVIKSLPPGGLQQWVEGVRPGDPKAWHYAKGIGRKFIGPKAEAALRWQLRGEDYTDALAKATAGRVDFEKSDPVLSEAVEQARNYGAIGAGAGLAYLTFGSKKDKLPANPNIGEIHGYIDRNNVPVSDREATKSVLVKEVQDWEKTQRPAARMKNSLMSAARPVTTSMKGPASLVPGIAINALMGGGREPDQDVRERLSFGSGLRRDENELWRELTGQSRRWNAKALKAIDESKAELQSRTGPRITAQDMLTAVASRSPIGAFLSTVLAPTPAHGGEVTPEDRAKAQAATEQMSGSDPYAQFAETVPQGVVAPNHARYGKTIERRVEREADRQMRGQKGEAPAQAKQQVQSADPYAAYVDPAQGVGVASADPQSTAPTMEARSFAPPVPLRQPPALGPGETATDIVKSAGAGVVKGVAGLGALPGTVEQLGRMGINYANRQFGGKEDIVGTAPFFPTYAETKGGVEKYVTGPLYEPKSMAGKYAGAIGEFAPGMLFPAAGATSLVGRAALNVVGPAVASETAGQMTAGTQAEPYARVVGALAGGQLPQTVGRIVSPNRIDPARARMGQVLDQEGVQLTAGDRTGSKPVRWLESNAQDTPLSGNRAATIKEAQAEQFTRAALRRAGIDAPRATPEVLDQAFTRIGNDFDQVSQALTVPITPQLAQRAQDVAQRYERITEPSLQNPLVRQLADDLAQRTQPAGGLPVAPAMLGDVYRGWRSDLGHAARGAGRPNIQDHRTERAIYELQRLLDDTAERYLRGTNPQLADTWRRARTEYRNILAIERAATGAGENAALGLISPAGLRNATISLHGRRNYARGDGDFAELARAGEALLRPLPQSGTNPRAMASAGGAALGSAVFGIPGAAAGALAPMAGQAVLGRATMSPLMQQYLSNQLMAGTRDLPGAGRFAVMPGANAQQGEVVIYPNGDPRNALMRH